MLKQKDAANMLGISTRRLRQLVTEGKLPNMPEGGYAGPALVNAWVEIRSQGKTGPARRKKSDDDVPVLLEERAFRERAERELAELKFERESGKVVPVEEVRKTLETILTIHRNRLLALPASIATQALTFTDPKSMNDFLQNEMTSLLNEVVSQLEILDSKPS